MTLQGEILVHYPLPAETSRFALVALTRLDNALWFAAGSVVYRLDIKTGLYQHYECPLPEVKHLAILHDTLWAGTDYGLAHIRLSTGPPGL